MSTKETNEVHLDLGQEVRQAAHRAIEDNETRGFIVFVIGQSPEDTASLIGVEDDVDMVNFIKQSVHDLFIMMQRTFEARVEKFKNRHTEETP